MNERMELIKKAMEDETFVEKIAEVKNAEELKAVLVSIDVELTEQEAIDFFNVMKAQLENSELSADDLDNVAGGFGVGAAVAGIALVGGCYVAGTLTCKWVKKQLRR